jgi:4-amino-4-deoxy-L-arabinose transferase-like glycosyltransferase
MGNPKNSAFFASSAVQKSRKEIAMLRPTRWLLLIIILSTLLRLGAAIYLGDTIEILPGIHDQVTYDALARRVLTGHGFSYAANWWPATRANEPTAHFSFLYSLYLAGVYAIFGLHPLAARLLQALVAGVLMPLLLYRITRRTTGETTALVAAACSAVYIYFIYYGASLLTETFSILAILASLDLALNLAEKPSWKQALLLGLALGTGVLLRQTLLLFVPFLLLWLLWQARGRIRWYHLVLPVVIIALLIAPWTVRNYFAFGRFVLLNTNAGFAFFWSNHPIYGTHYVSVLPPDGPTYQDLIPPDLWALDEAAMDSALMRQGLQFVLDDPGRYLLLCLGRIPAYFKFWPSAESSTISNISRVGSFGFFLPFMLYGLVLSFRRWRDYLLLYLFALIHSGLHIATWAMVRYRLPVDAVLLPFAGLAVVDLAGRVGKRWRGSAARQDERERGDGVTG